MLRCRPNILINSAHTFKDPVTLSARPLFYYRHQLIPAGLEQGRLRTERKLTMPVLAFGVETVSA
jgi:hypothetical protein